MDEEKTETPETDEPQVGAPAEPTEGVATDAAPEGDEPIGQDLEADGVDGAHGPATDEADEAPAA